MSGDKKMFICMTDSSPCWEIVSCIQMTSCSLETVAKFRHLGAEMANEIKERYSCSQYIFLFSRPIWKSKYLNLKLPFWSLFMWSRKLLYRPGAHTDWGYWKQRIHSRTGEIERGKVKLSLCTTLRYTGRRTIEWRKLHSEELNDLYSSPNIFQVIKSRRMRWSGHVTRLGGEERRIQGLGRET
jgi:hypothetical protein